ncbi:MAG: beta-N-acetylglucosaminidase domain-containing protein [Muribaculaceae bacterium]|nr:beta-N-acetylglucosaminidase domain-containing protein [Muribaculaceae bacterium]
MTSLNRLTAAIIASAAAIMPALAQTEAGFDFSTQRGEKQVTNPVPGKIITDRPFVVNPTPAKIEIASPSRMLDVSKGLNVKNVDKRVAEKTAFITPSSKGPKLKVEIGDKALKAGVDNRSGAYRLTVGPKEITILAVDEPAAFYALQSLRQVLESTATPGMIPCMTIDDSPSLLHRGVVEGFYGTPWSHDVRLSLIDFYGKNKLNTYIYGPKDDPYHSSPNWRLPYPDDQAAKIKELVEACNDNYVKFVWAIHPGKDIKWNEEDYQNLLKKFNVMYNLGVRSFALFFDDISGEGTNPMKQIELLNRLNREFVKAKGDVDNLTMCPTDYSRLWANPTENGSLAIFGRHLDPDINVMYTGDVVCSDLTPNTIEFLDSRIKRPGYYWWNFPVSDYCRNYILQGPSYGLDTTLTDRELVAFVSNPMEHGEASKLALYGVADYTWNIPAYNPMDSWERGLRLLMPEAHEAYRTFAIHSADTETGYRRDESWETKTFPFDNYTPEQFNRLREDFEKVAEAPAVIENRASNKQLVKELKPWLDEFAKIGQRGLRTLDLIKMYPTAGNADFWSAYVNNMMSAEDLAAFDAHRSGTMKLHPFYVNTMSDLLADFYHRLSGNVAAMYSGIGVYPNLGTKDDKLMLDDSLTTYFNSGRGQRPGHWIGLDLKTVRPVHEINIRQGRNDVDDTDYYDHAILESSVDGKSWKQIGDTLRNQYVISWTGEPVDARFLRLRRLDSKNTHWMTIRTFEVNPANPAFLPFAIEAADPRQFARAFDSNPETSFKLRDGSVSFTTNGQRKSIKLLTGKDTFLTISQLDSNGNQLSAQSLSTPYGEIEVNPSTSKIVIDGTATIYEIVI